MLKSLVTAVCLVAAALLLAPAPARSAGAAARTASPAPGLARGQFGAAWPAPGRKAEGKPKKKEPEEAQGPRPAGRAGQRPGGRDLARIAIDAEGVLIWPTSGLPKGTFLRPVPRMRKDLPRRAEGQQRGGDRRPGSIRGEDGDRQGRPDPHHVARGRRRPHGRQVLARADRRRWEVLRAPAERDAMVKIRRRRRIDRRGPGRERLGGLARERRGRQHAQRARTVRRLRAICRRGKTFEKEKDLLKTGPKGSAPAATCGRSPGTGRCWSSIAARSPRDSGTCT